MKKHFTAIVKLCIISVYLIILAGATVRMTGSGMGCPDWPKCFGHLIPPTEIDQLLWKPNTSFNKGIIIIDNEKLLTAKEKFTTGVEFNLINWKPYTKHNYAKFNATHTWVEYINRLVSVLSGLFFLVLIIVSLTFWKEKKNITLLSFLAFFLMLFEAWLGKTVVDSNLASTKIGIHMLVALAIVGLLLLVLFNAKGKTKTMRFDSLFRKLAIGGLLLAIVQVVLGIEVRQFVDEQLKVLGFEAKNLLELSSNTKFLIHRSFSIVVVILTGWLFYRNRHLQLNYTLSFWILLIVLFEIGVGMLIYYLDFPFGTQAIHLLLATLLFGVQFYLVLETKKK